jgi:hypothetical protein
MRSTIFFADENRTWTPGALAPPGELAEAAA